MVAFQGGEPAVADRHPVGVPRQVLEHLPWSAERRLGVDDPFGPGARGEPAAEFPGVGQRTELAVEREPPPVERGPEHRQELAPEDAAEDTNRQEEPRPAGDPPRGVGREPAAGDDAMDVGVVLEVLPPGVQHGEEADLGPEVLGIGGDLSQGGGGGLEQEAVDHPRVLQGDRVERRGQGEDDVEIRDRQEFRFAGLRPVGGGVCLTLGAVAIAAGVVGDPPVPAPVAGFDMAAQRRGPTGRDVAQGVALLGPERVPVPVEEGVPMASDDVGDFETGRRHGIVSPGRGPSRSRGLRVASTATGETWV